MPVFNGEKYLQQAIESILSQTLSNFEFLIVDDGSTDASASIARSFGDSRIKLLINERNLGIVEALNKGIAAAKGRYIARMDSDDISLRRRLENQVTFLDKHPDIGLCGTWIKLKGLSLRRVHRNPADPDEIKATLFFRDIIAHPTVMMRTEWIRRHNLFYDSTFPHAEDWELWQRASSHFHLANIPEALLEYRLNPKGVSSTNKAAQMKTIRRIYRRSLGGLGIEATEEEIDLHFAVSSYGRLSPACDYVFRAEKWLERLWEANQTLGLYPEPAFSHILADRWVHLCLAASQSEAWPLFSQSRLSTLLGFGRGDRIRFFLLCLLGWGKTRDMIKTTFNKIVGRSA